jgi:hypothetical protein
MFAVASSPIINVGTVEIKIGHEADYSLLVKRDKKMED